MKGGLLVHRRDAHQARDRQAEVVAAKPDEGVGLAGFDARLLGLLAGIHLDEAIGPAVLLRHLGRKQPGKLLPVQAFDGVEKPDRFANLVGLQRPDEMKPDIGKLLLQAGPFGQRFLDPILAEQALAGRDRRADIRCGLGLRHGDQGHLGRVAPGRDRSRGDAGPDRRQAFRRCRHCPPPASWRKDARICRKWKGRTARHRPFLRRLARPSRCVMAHERPRKRIAKR